MRPLALALIILATPGLADPPAKDCFCTDSDGTRVELGERACLRVDGRAYMALCDMSVNVPTWRDTGEGCLAVEFRGSSPSEPVIHLLKPSVEPTGVLSKI